MKDGQLDSSVKDPSTVAFGFGRRYVFRLLMVVASNTYSLCRVCPGRHLAENMLFTYIASILHTYDITPPLDEHGHPIRIQPRAGSGIVS